MRNRSDQLSRTVQVSIHDRKYVFIFDLVATADHSDQDVALFVADDSEAVGVVTVVLRWMLSIVAV